MNRNEKLEELKLKLQSYGALHPDAWAAIQDILQITRLKTNESFIRKDGQFAWLACGLLKEYNAAHRKRPAIVNFLATGDCLITRKHNKQYYLKACTEAVIYQIGEEQLQVLYQQFKELYPIYKSLCAEYDEEIAYRQFLLEQKLVPDRIKHFIQKKRHILPLLTKKDIANYLQLEYDYFIRFYSKIL